MFSTFRKFLIILLLIFYILPHNIFAATNAGFIPENIWYSKDPFEEGEKIKVYTLVFNPDARELSGTVIFLDDNTLLGKKSFTVNPKGVKDISIDWLVTAGKHNIYAKIESAKFLTSKGTYEDVYLEENETDKSSRDISKKIITNTKISSDTNILNDLSKISTDQIGNIQDIIKNKTPENITNSLEKTNNFVENTRVNLGIDSTQKKQDLERQIQVLNNKKDDSTKFIKPFKYVELFFFSLFNFILNNKVVFYILSVFILFFFLRYLWHLFF